MRYANSVLRLLLPLSLMLLFGGSAMVLTGCPSKKVKKAGCDSDKDCKKGLHCVNKKCQQCATDDHCPDGKTCKDGACTSKNQCSADSDCEDGKVCKDGTCTACSADSECGTGGKCNSGKCARAKSCKKDEDCEDDEDCVNGTCQRPWKTSTPIKDGCKLGTVYFAFDQASIAPEHRKTLDEAAECIKKNKGRDVYVIGHTDTSGTEEYNVALSERRARTVADYLSRLGIDPAKMRVIPKGESETSGTATKDRRVVFEWR